jgi:TonB-linked SusC/RagA family outer membrane protein
MKRITLLFVFLIFLGMQGLLAQKKITGTVTSGADGTPIPGASVVAKESPEVGAVTNFQGKYTLEVPEGTETLVFSFVGMQTKEEAIGDRTVVNVSLESTEIALDDVVVTALGISREKKALGYAVQEVNEEELNSTIQNDALSALSGKVSGVQINSSTKMGGSQRILIRGANSITGENQPLIVVDGIPVDNSEFNNNSANGYGGDANGFGGYDLGNTLNDISPEDIESVSVLKGPAAAIYGSRAANGVIVINTKQPQRGKNAISIDFSSKLGFEQVYLLPNLQTKYGGGAIISNEDGGRDGFEVVEIEGQEYLIPQYQVDESWGPRYDPNIKVLHWDAFDKESYPDDYLNPRPWVAPENDVKDYYDLGVSWTNNISLSRSGNDYGVRFSYTNANIQGTMPGSHLDRNNFSLKGNARLSKRLSVNSSLNYVNQKAKGRPQVGYGDNSVGQKFYQWGQRQLDYERLKEYKNNDGTQRTWNRNAWNDPTPKYSDNPYWAAYENYTDDERNRFYGNVSLTYDITEGLQLRGSVFGDTYNFYNRERIAVGSQSTSKYYEAVRTKSEFNYEGLLSYTKQFDMFGIDALAGVNQRNEHYDFNRGNTSGGLIVPEIYSLLNSNDNALTNDFTEEKQVNSIFASASFDIKGMLFLEGTVRNEWSSALPEDNNSYFYPSASASFLFSELLSDVSWLDLGKVRFSWAKVGNDTDPYRVKTTYNYNGNGPFQGAPRLVASTGLNNANLKAETTTSTEVGIEFVGLNNRVNLSATYFNNVTTDQIMPLDVSKATGYDSKYINSGQMTNKGIELSLSVIPVSIDNFQWELGANYTKINNTLDELYGDIKSLDIVRAPFGGVFLRASVGDTYGQFWGHDFIYDDDGNRVVGDNGVWLQTPSLVPMGSVIPDYNLGIRNSFRILNSIDVSVLLDIQQGGKFYSLSHMWGMYSGMLEETAATNDKGNEIRDPVDAGGGIKLDAVTGDVTFNDDGTYTVENTAPNETYISGIGWAARHYHGYGTPSAQSLFDADYVKLRELTVGYTLPDILGPVKNVRVSLYGRNLLTWGLDQEGFDPEMTVNGSGNVQGIDGGLYPSSRTYGINLKFGF